MLDVDGVPPAGELAALVWGLEGGGGGSVGGSDAPPPSRPVDALAVVEPRTAILAPPSAPLDPVEPARALIASYATSEGRRTAHHTLTRIARLWGLPSWEAVPWGRLRAKHTTAVRALMGVELDARRWGPNTGKLTLTILNRVLAMARRLGHMTHAEYADAIDLPKVRGQPLPVGRALSDGEIERFWRFVDDELPGAYASLVRGIFAVGMGGGLRRSEIAGLTLESFVDGRLRFVGKGRKDREQRLPGWAVAMIDAWLIDRDRLDVSTPALFVPIARDGRVADRPFTGAGIFLIVSSNIAAAGIAHISPHDLRRTFGTTLLKKQPVAVVQRLMAHNDPATTLRYDRTPAEVADKAIDDLDVWAPK